MSLEVYNLKDTDITLVGDMVHAGNPGDDHWVKSRQSIHKEEWEAGRITRDMLVFALAICEAHVAESGHEMGFLMRLQHKAFAKRMRREIWLHEQRGEPAAVAA